MNGRTIDVSVEDRLVPFEQVVLMAVDWEHLDQARRDGLGRDGRLVSFGTDFWSEDARDNPENWDRGLTAFFYAAIRGVYPAASYATWQARFEGYRRRESFTTGELEATRPESTNKRALLPPEHPEHEPEWAGYMLFDELNELSDGGIPLASFTIRGQPFTQAVVRHPLLVERSR
jgi:hypothetical protein